MIQSYEDLEVYQRSYKVALEIHQLTLRFPEYERYDTRSKNQETGSKKKSCLMHLASCFMNILHLVSCILLPEW